jgi:glycosyltransferase involved in cell wall biosynthesis
MRIGLVVPGFSAEPSDWCIPALRHLARSLATVDDVRVVAIRYPYRASRYTIEGAETIALGGAVRHGAATFELWRNALRVLRTEHRRRPFDVLHAFWATESGLLAALAGRLLRVPTLVSVAGGELVALRDIDYGDQRLAWERLKVGASLRLAGGVSAGSRQLARTAARHVLPGHACVHVAPLGVDLDLFHPPYEARACASRPLDVGATLAPTQPPRLVRMPHAPRLLHVGTLTPVKDQATLLSAFARVRQGCTTATLEVVGDGPLRLRLERLADDLGLGPSVSFRGDVDHADLPSVYRAADICVVSSRHEAQCMVAVEAAACGVPVAGTRVGVLPELTRAVSPVGDVEALTAAITSSLHDTAAMMAVSEVRAAFGLSACTERFRELYMALIAA